LRRSCTLLLLAACESGMPSTEAPDECITDTRPGVHDFVCDGIRFTLSLPDACTRAGCGVILDIHGATMSAEMEDANTNLRELGRRDGYIVIQPSAGEPPASYWESTNDPAIFSFLERAIRVFTADEDRIHVTGFSQGASMTWRMLCDHGERFASVAPAAGAPGCPYFPVPRRRCFLDEDNPSENRLPILYMHGIKDGLVDYGCGREAIDRVIAAWGLTSSSTIASSTEHVERRFTGDGPELVEMLIHNYVAAPTPLAELVLGSNIDGHCYPGSTDDGKASGQLFSFACLGENAFVWGERVIGFFRDHPKSR